MPRAACGSRSGFPLGLPMGVGSNVRRFHGFAHSCVLFGNLHPMTSRIAAVALAVASLACFGNPAGVRGVAGTAPAPNVPWTPPRSPEVVAAPRAGPLPELPPDVAERIARLKLVDVIDIALRNNTATSAAWADARAAAARYGAAKGQYYPAIAIDGAVTAIKTVPSAGRAAVPQQVYRARLSLSLLLFDFGGRSRSAR